MAIDGFCQNGSCKKPVAARVNTTIQEVLEKKDGIPTKIGERQLDLCADDADFFLSFRDEKGQGARVRKFVAGCHTR